MTMTTEMLKMRLQETALEVLDRIPALILISDQSASIVYVNHTVETLFGYKPEEVLGDQWWKLTRDDPEEQARARDFVRRCTIGEIEPNSEAYEESMVARDGKELVILWRDVLGPHNTLIGVGRDITERRKIESELRRAQSEAEAAATAKAQFLANMSHEIRTPLNAVVGVTELLLTESMTASQLELVEVIRNSGSALLTLVNDVLDYSRIESGGLELERLPFGLASCLEESLGMVKAQASVKRLELGVSLDSDVPPRVVGDAARLRQILTNLLANAVKFTHQGSVRVRVESGAVLKTGRRELIFSVEDTGVGIPEDRVERIFDSFTQADATVARRYGGTGLGLAISRNLCEMMEGSLWVESREGEGSKFSFSILIEVADQEDIAVPRGPVARVAEDELPALRILLAERQCRQSDGGHDDA